MTSKQKKASPCWRDVKTRLTDFDRGRGKAYDAGVCDACLRPFREHGYAIPD